MNLIEFRSNFSLAFLNKTLITKDTTELPLNISQILSLRASYNLRLQAN
jgi:hypothetical protein